MDSRPPRARLSEGARCETLASTMAVWIRPCNRSPPPTSAITVHRSSTKRVVSRAAVRSPAPASGFWNSALSMASGPRDHHHVVDVGVRRHRPPAPQRIEGYADGPFHAKAGVRDKASQFVGFEKLVPV